MKREFRSIGMIDSKAEEEAQKELYRQTQQEYLLLTTGLDDDESKGFEFVEGRNNLIDLLRGMIDAQSIDIDESYVLTEENALEDRITVRTFIVDVLNVILPEDLRFDVDPLEDYEEDLEEEEE